MIRRMNWMASLLVIGAAAVCSAADAPALSSAARPADQDPILIGCRDALLAQFNKLEAALPEMTRSGDEAADRLIAGGLLLAGGDPGFVEEATQRAGGLMMTAALTDKITVAEKDVLLVGALTNADDAAEKACRRGKDAGAYVVLFSPTFADPRPPIAALCDSHVVNFTPAGGPNALAGAAGAFAAEQRAAAASSLFNLPALWTYTGELVGSLTRKGKTPVIFQSNFGEGAAQRRAKYDIRGEPSKKRFHADLCALPQPEGRVGHLYLDALRRQVTGLRGAVLEQMSAAAAMMADCVRAGGSVQVQTVSHYTEHDVQFAGLPDWLKSGGRRYRTPELLAAAMKPGDVCFELGYVNLRQPYIEAVEKAGGKSIVAVCHSPAIPLDGPQPVMLIDSQWDYGDAAIVLPGYDVKILPASGVLQTAIFRMVIAKAEALAAK